MPFPPPSPLASHTRHTTHNHHHHHLLHRRSYGVLFSEYAKSSEARLPASMAPATKETLAKVLALVAPKALVARTTQIVGTFMLLNGIIYMLKDVKPTEALGWADPIAEDEKKAAAGSA